MNRSAITLPPAPSERTRHYPPPCAIGAYQAFLDDCAIGAYQAFLDDCARERIVAAREVQTRRELQNLCVSLAEYIAANFREDDIPDPPTPLELYKWAISDDPDERGAFEMELGAYDASVYWDIREIQGLVLEARRAEQEAHANRSAQKCDRASAALAFGLLWLIPLLLWMLVHYPALARMTASAGGPP